MATSKRSEQQKRTLGARLMGKSKSEKKTKAARDNGKKGGRRFRPLETIDCTCRYPPEDHTGHIRTCLYRKALERRIEAGLIEPIEFKK